MRHAMVAKTDTPHPYLPAVTSAPAAERRPAASTVGGSETLLLVDDTETVLRFLSTLLQIQGYTTLTAHDGEEALTVLARHEEEIALILTDLVMPRCGGCELLSAVRARGNDVPVIAISGYTPNPDELLTEGFASIMTKPLTALELAGSVRRILNNTSQPAVGPAGQWRGASQGPGRPAKAL